MMTDTPTQPIKIDGYHAHVYYDPTTRAIAGNASVQFLFVTRWPSTCDAQRDQNSEPKLRPPAVSKSLTRSTMYRMRGLHRSPATLNATCPARASRLDP